MLRFPPTPTTSTQEQHQQQWLRRRRRGEMCEWINRNRDTYPSQCFDIMQCILGFEGRLSGEERHKTAPWNRNRTRTRTNKRLETTDRIYQRKNSPQDSFDLMATTHTLFTGMTFVQEKFINCTPYPGHYKVNLRLLYSYLL